MSVPCVNVFDDIYPKDESSKQRSRWKNLLDRFNELYSKRAKFVARSPGRVNLIGEHVDYSLYQCIPMAIAADVLLAVSVRNDNRIYIANVMEQNFPSREIVVQDEQDVEIDAGAHDWSNYFKAGLRGARTLLKQDRGSSTVKGMDILVDGTVPTGGGLSSSAAFVCASALAVLRANGIVDVNKQELVELAIVSERAVGVNSGGLDQSASVLAVRDSALLVSFKPSLSATPVEFPSVGPELVFVIVQSFIVSNKQETGPIHYNLRVVEVTLAAKYLAATLKLKSPLPKDHGPLHLSLRGFQDTYFEETEGIEDNTQVSPEQFQKQLERLIQLVKDTLVQEEGYTREDIAAVLGISVNELNEQYTTKVPVRAQRFMLRQRALHVFGEALRVKKVVSLLTSGNTEPSVVPHNFGALLNETQASCRDLYDCSCPEVDEICKIGLRAGTYGGRVTGAGWGGCTVHLVPKEKIDEVTSAWKREYYEKRFPEKTADDLAEAIIVTKPGRGSLVYEGGALQSNE